MKTQILLNTGNRFDASLRSLSFVERLRMLFTPCRLSPVPAMAVKSPANASRWICTTTADGRRRYRLSDAGQRSVRPVRNARLVSLIVGLILGVTALVPLATKALAGYGSCSSCSCSGFFGSSSTCDRSGCGHHYDSHW